MKNLLSIAGLTVFLLAGFVTASQAYSVTGEHRYSSETRYNLQCNNGKSTFIYLVKASGDYCTKALSCDGDFDRVARWVCGE